MHLTVYQLCESSQANPHTEKTVRTQWTDAPPDKGAVIGMGSDRNFQVVKVYSFQPVGKSAVEFVHVAMCELPDSNLPEEEWGCWAWKDRYPEENMYIRLEEIGLPDLGCCFNFTGDGPPKIGARIMGGILAGSSDTRMVSVPTKWTIESCEAFEPITERPYTKVTLCYCKVVAMTEAAVAA
jgi:hypothetical protein